MRMSVVSIALLVGLSTWGCGVRGVTSGQVGCPASEIVISNDTQGLTQRTWTAECRGRTFYCSSHGGGEYAAAQVSCTEEAGGGDDGSESSYGCTKDADCKGDRICEGGACVSPP